MKPADATDLANAASPVDEIRVWHPLVRLSHWLVAAIVVFNLFVESVSLHHYAGYTAVGAVVIRLIWGVTRSPGDHAHIGRPAWSSMRQHWQALRQGQVHRSLGHNPLGMCMALLLWALVIGLGLTGWMSQLDQFWGEEWLTDIHEGLANTLQACVLLHLAGVVVMSRLQRESLVKAMLTGRKRAA